MNKKRIAFVCVHNSCRSQMAELIAKEMMGNDFEIVSAGSEIVSEINPDAVRLIKERYQKDMRKTQYSKLVDDLEAVDILITMGCDVSCPTLTYNYTEDWGLIDPTGQEDDVFIEVIELIEEKISNLKKQLKVTAYYGSSQ